MLLRTKHLKHTLVHLELRSCACSVISIMSNSVMLWTVAHQAPLSMGFSRQEYWSGLPCPPSGDLPDSGIKLASLMSLTSPVLAGELFTIPATWETNHLLLNIGKSLKIGNNFSFLFFFWSLFSAKITINRLKNFTSISQSTQGTENPGLWISIVWAWDPHYFHLLLFHLYSASHRKSGLQTLSPWSSL